jgi:gamma-glutamylcyclotransferase (GGCT)/AIG2-like uncharacterized protein YtfP
MAEAGEADGRLPFFVYGTLRPGYGNYRHFLAPVSHTVVPARLPGALMYARGGGIPYVTLGGEPTDSVVGALVDVAPWDYEGVLACLDRLEGHPDHYVRTAVEVVTETGSTKAWAYLASRRVAVALSKDWLVAGGDWASVAGRWSRVA